jgi:integrase/recombinase XerD
LNRDAQEFLRFKRAMGIAYWRGEFVLNGFVRFVAQRWGDRGEVELDDAMTRWCARIAGRKAVTLGNEFGVVRQLCLFRRRHDPTSYVPEHALAPIKESTFLPYIFSHEEVRRVLVLATSHHGRFIWAPMLRALILVLYCTGPRLGEAVRLRMTDIDLDRGILKIPHSKGRARIVAIRMDFVAELHAAAIRHRHHRDPRLSRSCQRGDDRAVHHHQPSDEARSEEIFWQHSEIEPAKVKPWKPKPDLLAFLLSL